MRRPSAGDQTRLGPEFDAIDANHVKRRGADYLKRLGNLTSTSIPIGERSYERHNFYADPDSR